MLTCWDIAFVTLNILLNCINIHINIKSYLKIAISILINKIFATSKKINIITGGIQPPGTQFVPKKL